MMKLQLAVVAVMAASAGACTGQVQGPTEPTTFSMPVFEAAQHAQHAGAHGMQTGLSGAEEVPANASEARGQAIFHLSNDGDTLSYRLIVVNIENVTQAHIHLAAPGVNGPVVAWLYPSAPPAQLIPGRSQGLLGKGDVTGASLVGPLAGQELSALIAAIRAGNTYVNVHTSQLPPGEIRGQID